MADPDVDAWLASKTRGAEPDVDAWLAAKGSPPPAVPQEAEGPPPSDPVAALLARETAARRLARGVRSPSRTPGPELSETEKQSEAAMFGGANSASLGMFNRALGGVDYLRGGSPSYSAGVDKVAAHEAELQKNYPLAYAGGSIVGGVGTGIGLARSPLTFSRIGATIPQRVGMGALEGGAFGVAQGAGQTYSGNLPDYVKNGLVGGGFGLAGGAAGEAIGAGAGSIYGSLRDRAHGAFPEPVLRGARADVQGLQNLPRLGPDAMLPDAGPSMQAVAQQAALGIGPNRTAIVSALMERDRGTVPRLRADVTEAIGPAPRVSQVEEGIDAGRRQINTEYAPVLRGRAIEPGEANRVMGRLNELALTSRENLDDVIGALTLPGTRNAPDLSPQSWLSARQRIDSMIEAANSPINPNRYRASVLGDVRRMIDDELAANVPGIKAVDAKFAANRAEQTALERGGTVLDTGKQALHPDDLRDIMRVDATPQGMARAGPPAANVRLRQGTRADIDRRVGTKANDLTELERTLGTPEDWNAQKLAQIFGEEPTQAVRDSVARNRQFRETYQRIAQGSDTAQRQAAAKTADIGAPQMPIRNIAGTVEQVGRWGLAQAQEAQRQAQREAIARIMATRDPAMVEALRQQLLNHARQTMPGIRATDRRGRGLIQGAGSVLGPTYEDYVR